MNDRFVLVVAEGFGTGRIRFGPGTWGSLVGLIWFALLLQTGNLWYFLAGVVVGLAASVWFCGAAEEILRQHDPSSIVLDEIVAVPICFLAVLIHAWARFGELPTVESFFTHPGWTRTVIVFVLFRVFDIAKPWPVKQSQGLSKGWGITADDFMAAVYVNLIQVPFLK